MNINQWRNYLAESKPERLLREITEDELGHIQQALDEMDNEDLAFNKIFDGKMRVVIDFPTIDRKSDLGQFVDFFKVSGYKVDWNKGMLSGVGTLHDNSPANVMAGLGLGMRGGDAPVYQEPKQKKIVMKIGKFFKKLSDLVGKQEVLFKKIQAHAAENRILGGVPAHPGHASGTQEQAALSEEELLNYRRLGAHIDMYLPDAGVRRKFNKEMIARYAKYWADNADYIKREVANLQNDTYSIIITRHPIDVLRMSDFDDITSCHSPPSRGTGESYYKCAVAEAHGHGAVAYVVETEHLKEWADDPNASLEEIENEMQTGEIFDDDRRYDAGSIEPVSRLRLRQVRYYEATQKTKPKTDDYKKAGRNPFDGIQLAIPEKRVYGERIPGFRDRVMKWAKESQQDQMQIVRRDSEPDNETREIQLDKFIKFGGSYEDNQIGPLIADFFGNEAGDGLPANTTGYVKQDTTTEDELDANLVGGLIEQFQAEVDDIADRWNNRYAYMEVEASAEDDGGGSVYIEMQAHMKIRWDADEWTTMPGYQEARYAAMELNDIGWGWVDSDGVNMQSDATRGEIIYSFAINFEGIMDGPNNMGEGRRGYAIDPQEFEDFCVSLNTLDDLHDGVKEMLERYYKREGYMQGGELGRIAREIIDGDLDTEWDMETDDRYEWDEVTQIDAIAKFDFGAFDPPLPEHNPAIAKKIAEDRDFQIQFRKAIHESAQRKMNTPYFVDTYWRVYLDASNDVIMECNLRVNDRSNDEQVSILEQVVTDNFDLDDLRDSVLRPLVIQAMNSRMPSGMQQSFNENARIVKSWKSFLKG